MVSSRRGHLAWGARLPQHAAGQSVISSSLNTAINGGSFKDNLTNALLANIGSQINAEGAKLIGDNGAVLGVVGKSVSHAVVAGVAAELAAITLDDIFTEPATRDAKVQSAGRIIGAVTGAAITNSAKEASSGASAAENVLVYNFLMHDEPAKMAKKLADCKGNSGCEINVCREMAQLSAKNEKSFESCRISGNGTVSTICYWGSLMQQASGNWVSNWVLILLRSTSRWGKMPMTGLILAAGVLVLDVL